MPKRHLRYTYRGESLRNGRIVVLDEDVQQRQTEIAGATIISALASADANVPAQVVPFFYDKSLEGWRRLQPGSRMLPDDAGRVEVMLEAPANPVAGDNTASLRKLGSSAAACSGRLEESGSTREAVDGRFAAGGFFGIGIYNSKSADNVGTLWRSAYMLDAKFLFTIGSRNTWEKSADTHKAWRSVPAFRYDNWASFCDSAPYQCAWVAVEMGGVPLHEFEHPERAVYILGGGCGLACGGCAVVPSHGRARGHQGVELQRERGRLDHHVRSHAKARRRQGQSRAGR